MGRPKIDVRVAYPPSAARSNSAMLSLVIVIIACIAAGIAPGRHR